METPLHPSSYPKDVGLSGLLADSPVPVKRWANSSPWPLLFAQERTASTFDEIPVMCIHVLSSYLSTNRVYRDFKDAESPDPAIRRELADQIRDACINVGFFYCKSSSRILCVFILKFIIIQSNPPCSEQHRRIRPRLGDHRGR
jgi:hypothetical protein